MCFSVGELLGFLKKNFFLSVSEIFYDETCKNRGSRFVHNKISSETFIIHLLLSLFH